MARRGQGDPNQWYSGMRWNAWSPQYPKPRNNRAKNVEKEKKEEVPGAYDAMPSGSSLSSSSPPSTDNQARAFMDAFMKFTKEQDQEVPPVLKEFLKQDVKEDLRDRQKKLNQHRAILQKIEGKKKAIKRDEEQWQCWTQEIRELIKKQKQRHEEQAAKLQEELETLLKKEEELRAGKTEDDVQPINVEEDEEDIETLLGKDAEAPATLPTGVKESMESGFNKQLQDMKEQMEEEYRMKFEAACASANHSMQQQYQLSLQMMQTQMAPNMGNQTESPPVNVLGLDAALQEGQPAKVAPFTRRYKAQDRDDVHSPYGRPQETMQQRLERSHGTQEGNG